MQGSSRGLNYRVIDRMTRNLSTAVYQLETVNVFTGKIALSASTIIDLLSEDKTTLILNNPTPAELIKDIADITELRTDILSIFEAVDEVQVNRLRPLMFENQCLNLDPSLLAYCKEMTKDQSRSGFVQLTVYQESSLVDLKTRFDISNKSNETLAPLLYQVKRNLVPQEVVLQFLGGLISQAIDESLEESIKSSALHNTVSTVVLCIIWILVCLLIYLWYWRR